MDKLRGVWLPIITPFSNNKIDYISYKNLIDYYIPKGIAGIIPNGTTGECPTIEDYEFEELLDKTVDFNDGRLPIYYGLGGNNTSKILKQLKIVEKYKVDGILSVCPYYSRPDQKGIYEHFKIMSETTNLKIIIYNIPYRTGRNIENDTIFKLSELKNIIGVKDSCGNLNQSMDLIANCPNDFSLLTGEDILYYVYLALGGDGGIIAASHLNTEKFISISNYISDNNFHSALETWKKIEKFIPLLFKESNPAPIKYCLEKLGLIESSELRLPLTRITDNLKNELDKYL